MDNDLLTVYHGAAHPYGFVKAGCWVTLAEAEASGYALTHAADNPNRRQYWVLELRVHRDQIDWKDGYGDSDFDGQHGTLRIDVPVVGKRVVSL